MFFMIIFFAYQSISHGLGDTVSPMKIQFLSVSINVVLDPILIFGLLIFPKLGVVGAAYATVFARFIGALYAFWYLFRKKKFILPSPKQILPDFTLLKKILKISIPASVSHSITSFGFLILQGFVNTFGTVVISVYAIGNRLIGFYMMPAMGISHALSAIVGQNLGAKNTERAIKSLKTAFVLIMGIMFIGALILFNFGATLTKIFINDPEVIEAGVRMFRITSIAAFAFGIIFVFMGVFNGAGHTLPPMIINMSRLWVLRIPITFILSDRLLQIDFFKNSFLAGFLKEAAKIIEPYNYDALWWAMLISNITCAIVSVILLVKGSWKNKKID